MGKRVFLIVLDSFGIGASPDANSYGDEGANTFASIRKSPYLHIPNMEKLGIYHIDGVENRSRTIPCGVYGRLLEQSKGKDTTIGHWEIAGIVMNQSLPTYPNGFPQDIIDQLEKETGRKILCNKPYSGTDVIRDYGEEHMKTGALIIYTSADSVLQIAAHEDIIPVETLYQYCNIARNIMTGEHGVGRVIARPFIGADKSSFVRTARRHDFSLVPPKDTMLDRLQQKGITTIGIGKIYDIFAGKGIGERFTSPTISNEDGMNKTLDLLKEDFEGLVFTNLVETDMIYGHRRDIDGYAKAISQFDKWLGQFLNDMKEDDILMITADHGCDPGFLKTTDHTREYIPLLAYGKRLKENCNLGTRETFADIGATIVDLFGCDPLEHGTSFKNMIRK